MASGALRTRSCVEHQQRDRRASGPIPVSRQASPMRERAWAVTTGAAPEMLGEPAGTGSAQRGFSTWRDQASALALAPVGAQRLPEPQRSRCASHGGPAHRSRLGQAHEHPTRQTRQVTAAAAQSSGADAARPRLPGAARGQPAPLLAQAQARARAGERRYLKAAFGRPRLHRGAAHRPAVGADGPASSTRWSQKDRRRVPARAIGSRCSRRRTLENRDGRSRILPGRHP